MIKSKNNRIRRSFLVILWVYFYFGVVDVDASVFVPRHPHPSTLSRRNSDPSAKQMIRKRRKNNGLSSSSHSVRPAACFKTPVAFSTTIFRGGGGPLWLFAGAIALVQTIKTIQSEPFQRSLYFWIHAGPIVAHYKFTQWYLQKWKKDVSLEHRNAVYERLHNRYCQPSLQLALQLKGLYVKIAQIVSSRPDFVPPQYIELFTTVQDSIPQWPLEQVIDILNESYQDQNLTVDDLFESIDPIALGSASIGQVHRAILKQTEHYGSSSSFSKVKQTQEEVAIKIMHPGAEQMFHHDFAVFRTLCKFALHGWEPILDECYRQIMSEFDYRTEAQNLENIRTNMLQSPFRHKVQIPQPLPALTTKHVLVMELIKGTKLATALEDRLGRCYGGDTRLAQQVIARKQIELVLGKEKADILKGKSSLPMHGTTLLSKVKLFLLYRKVKKYIDLLVDVQGYQILHDGLFQGDPHPGNIIELPDGRLGLVDYGQVKRISDQERFQIAKIVDSIGSRHQHHRKSPRDIAVAAQALGFETKRNDPAILAQFATLFFDSDIDGKTKLGCATPQVYFSLLNKADPLVNVPDVAVFVARSSFILRGMGTLLDQQIRTSMRWAPQAKLALQEGASRLSKKEGL